MISKKLMVIIPDRLSEIAGKGEVIERYYNPGNVFDEVHIVMTNDDMPDKTLVQKTVGAATLYVHNLPGSPRLFIKSLGWRPWLLGDFANQAIELARKVGPSLIRCHGAHLNGFVAARIKATLNIPYVLSLHINPDEDVRGRAANWKNTLEGKARKSLEKIALDHADLVMPVYKPIVPYLERLGITHYEVCYNALNPLYLAAKNNYALHDPVRVISVGRQFREKNPDNLIRAAAQIPNVHLTIVGDGPYHDYLHKIAAECGMEARMTFHRALANDELCRRLPEFDIFAVHTEYWEISKSVLEPLLTGLPAIINKRLGKPVPELTDDICLLVENSVESYYAALSKLIKDHEFREQLARRAYRHARENWSPAVAEAKFANIYRRFMLGNGRAAN